MQCPVCGEAVYESAIFCAGCGATMPDNRHEESDATPARRSRPWLRALAWIFTAAAAVLILASVCPGLSGASSVHYVPDVVGRNRAAAEARLERSGFDCVIGHDELSSMTPPGAVIRQFPEAGTPTARKKVTLVLSVGPGVSVPDLTGQPQEAALAALRECSLAGRLEKREPSASFPAGTVTRSWPVAGQAVREGTAVRLAVSTGAPSTTTSQVPDVTGKSGRNAKLLLRSTGLTYVVGAKRFSSSVPRGCVMSQRPRPGSKPPADRRVRVALSLGRGVRMPKVIGKPAQEASRLLTGMGLRIATRQRYAEVRKDHVISSTPTAGKTIAAGSSVTLLISRGPAEGFLTVESEPDDWAVWVYVDGGKARGQCPLTLRLPAGEHSVALWDPNRQKQLAFPVTVEPGQTLMIQKDLERESS